MEYLKLTRELKIQSTSLDVKKFADCPSDVLLGQDVRLGFPEVIGIEDILIDILENRRQQFDLEGIVRILPGNKPLYFDLCIRMFSNQLFLFFEEVTMQMLWQQTLLEQTHENSLFLLRLNAFQNQGD
ncbi:hypothetical protein [Fortiea contorta]|uniref:hypothetical protein n=1 Tax=Fortiea contorta TaxID=1892405 RepID=UPI00034895A8|nr:hypothetical protein [Fortiea contorta]